MTTNSSDSQIWIFNGSGYGSFPSGVFTEKSKAHTWIIQHKLSGTLTLFPMNDGLYDWTIKNKYFESKNTHETSPEFIQNFSCSNLEHYHYENGVKD